MLARLPTSPAACLLPLQPACPPPHPPACARSVSDDFYPANPASHTAHIANCAFNSLFMGCLVVPDWDMFHSRHVAALLHATARAVSGERRGWRVVLWSAV